MTIFKMRFRLQYLFRVETTFCDIIKLNTITFECKTYTTNLILVHLNENTIFVLQFLKKSHCKEINSNLIII